MKLFCVPVGLFWAKDRLATQQTVNLVLDTIRLAMKKEKKRVAAVLQLHSDQGAQLWDNTVNVKQRESLRQCYGREFLLHSENRVYLPA